ncbi:MAG: hypothetical protein PWQ52_1040 [Methanolobus sp.]|nr:hypothetical protein [Methanolobus sp.]
MPGSLQVLPSDAHAKNIYAINPGYVGDYEANPPQQNRFFSLDGLVHFSVRADHFLIFRIAALPGL